MAEQEIEREFYYACILYDGEPLTSSSRITSSRESSYVRVGGSREVNKLKHKNIWRSTKVAYLNRVVPKLISSQVWIWLFEE